MNINLVSIEKDGIVRLEAEGSMTSEDFRNAGPNPLSKIIGQHWSSNKVLLNMAKTSYMDSSALGWLLSCQKEFKNNGGLLVLHSIPPRVQQIFDLLRIGLLLPMAEDEPAALKLVNGEQA